MLKKLRNEQSGYTLIMTLIVMVVLMILGTALLNLSVAENRFTNRNEDKLQAYYIARSGAQAIADYMVADDDGDADNLIGKTSDSNNQIGNGNFIVSVEQDPSNATLIHITSTATHNGVTQDASLLLTKGTTGTPEVLNHAIVGDHYIGPNNGNANGATITGSIATKTTGGIGIDPNKVTVTGDEITDTTMEIPLVNIPAGAIDITSTVQDINGTTVNLPIALTNSDNEYIYQADSISVKNGGLVAVPNPSWTGEGPSTITHLYVEGDVSIETNGVLTGSSDSYLYIYVKGDHTVTFKGAGAVNNVFIYAPESTVEWNNAQHGELNGGIVGETVHLFNHTTITYNPDMANYSEVEDSNVGVSYVNYRWQD